MITNTELLNKIDEWNLEISQNDKHIHYGLLEIFIEFEKFLTESFIAYSLKDEGKNNFKPVLRINFIDEDHLFGLLKCDKVYIDYIKKIQEVKKFIFEEISCPFNKVFSTSEFQTYFSQIKILRDFIAHQSKESKYKYLTKVLNPNGINTYIKADTFLKKINTNKSKSYYSIYIDSLKFYSEIICDPRVNTTV